MLLTLSTKSWIALGNVAESKQAALKLPACFRYVCK